MDESGDGWLRESASRRAGVAQSPDGRRAITIFDPPLKEPCRGCTRSGLATRRGPLSHSPEPDHEPPRAASRAVIAAATHSNPSPHSAYPSGGIAPGFQALKFNHTPLLRRTRVSGPTQIPGGTSPPWYSNIQGPQSLKFPGGKGGSCHRTDGVPPEPSSPSWVTKPGSQWLPSVVPPGGLQSPKSPREPKGEYDTAQMVPPDEDSSLRPGWPHRGP